MGWDDADKKLEDRAERSYSNFADHPKWTVAKWVAVVVAGCLAISVVASLISTGGLFFQAKLAKVTAQPRVTKQIYGTENIVSQIKLFHDKCTGVQEKLAIFKNNYAKLVTDREAAHLKTDPLEQHAAVEALAADSQDVTAALNAAQSDVQAYNSAAANPTVNPFRTIFAQNGLPERIALPAGEAAANSFQLNCG